MSELRPEHWTAIIVAGLSLIGVLGGGMLAALAGWLKARADRQLAEANLEAQQAVTKQQIDQQIDQRLAAEVERLNGELDDLRSEMGALTANVVGVEPQTLPTTPEGPVADSAGSSTHGERAS